MKYLLEISDMAGSGIADEERARVESDTPIPVPDVGDEIYLPSSTGSAPDRDLTVKVFKRLFIFSPATDREDATAHIQVFCKDQRGNA